MRFSMKRGCIGLGVVVVVGAGCVADDPLRRGTVYGVVEGYDDAETGTWVWKGIPFARAPVGEWRWRAPQDPEAWDGVRVATDDPPPCPQHEMSGSWIMSPTVRGAEDCLYLNVYRPASGEEDLPVYVWIHGGANFAGEADLYDLEHLAAKGNLVTVVAQYRLGVMGFFTHPSLRENVTPEDASGNYGILDQIQALEWVRDNVAAFGGDPGNVTIAGESAGGHDVVALMVSPRAEGLFHRAVMQSGGMIPQSVAVTDRVANRTVEQALVMGGLAGEANEAAQVRQEMANADLAAALRGMTDRDIVQAHAGGPGMTATPVANVIEDGTVVPTDLLCTVEAGRFHQVPLLAGATTSETGSIHPIAPSLYPGMPNYNGLLDVVAGTKTIDEVLPTDRDKELWAKGREYGSLFWRTRMVDELVTRMVPHHDDVYVYSFGWGDSGVQPEPLGFIYGAAHALELPFFHGNEGAGGLADWWIYRTFTADNRAGREALRDAMVAYLAAFARTGNPNGTTDQSAGDLPEWRPWSTDPGGVKTLRLDADPSRARIAMDTVQRSMAEVRRALDGEPPYVRQHVMAVLSVMQPYGVFERGDYEFGGCS